MITEIGTDIYRAADLLRHGELVGIPTETVYGLAANALQQDAVLKIYAAKQRPRFNPLILHVPSLDKALPYIKDMSSNLKMLAQQFWPGSLTLLLPKSTVVNDLVTAGSSRVALRVPAHPLALTLLQAIDFPLAAPSANPSGYVSPTTAAHVSAQLNGKIAYILDGGACAVGLESTIAGEDEEGHLTVYRTGAVTPQMIEAITGIMPKLQTRPNEKNNPQTPGQLISHYATRTPLFLSTQWENYIPKRTFGKLLHISFSTLPSITGYHTHWVLAPDGDLSTAAKNLFSMLREADAGAFDAIVIDEVPAMGIGLAVNDRLHRAQHHLKGA